MLLSLFDGGLRCLLRHSLIEGQRLSGCPERGRIGIRVGGRDLLPSGWNDADGDSTLLLGQLCSCNESTDAVLGNLARPLRRASLVIAVPWIHRVCRAMVSVPHPLSHNPAGQAGLWPHRERGVQIIPSASMNK